MSEETRPELPAGESGGASPEPGASPAAEAAPVAATEEGADYTEAGTGDRWAHRRAEPRPLAFMWTVYLFTATAMTFAAISGAGGLTLDVYRPALRILLMTVAVGVAVVWPMVRLSQSAPVGPAAGASLKDWFAIVAPLQAIVWPQWLLAGWPVRVIAGLAGTLSAWAVLTAGMLALYFAWESGRERRDATGRSWMMAGFVGVAGLGPAGGAVWGLLTSMGPGPPGRLTWWMLSSPLSAVFEITRDEPSGPAVMAVWAVAANVAVAGLVCWFWSAAARRKPVAGVTSGPTSA